MSICRSWSFATTPSESDVTPNRGPDSVTDFTGGGGFVTSAI